MVRWRTDLEQVSRHAVCCPAFLKATMHALTPAPLRASVALSSPNTEPGARCGHCAFHQAGVACADVVRRRVKKRQALYFQGDSYGAVYAVCSGTLKSAMATADGTERVMGFPAPGELLGLDGSANGSYSTTTIALEDTEVCSISSARFAAQFAVAGLGREMLRMQQLLMLTGGANAEARLAQFLLNHALQLSSRGYSAHDFFLKMSRADMGSYLGLSLETVSRSFSALQKMQLLHVDKRAVRIADLDGLTRLAQSNQNRKWLSPKPRTALVHTTSYQKRTKPVSSAVITT
jgi:CRP/FNR family transcriptional regulator